MGTRGGGRGAGGGHGVEGGGEEEAREEEAHEEGRGEARAGQERQAQEEEEGQGPQQAQARDGRLHVLLDRPAPGGPEAAARAEDRGRLQGARGAVAQYERRAEGQVRREGGRGQEALREGDEGVQAALQAQAP